MSNRFTDALFQLIHSLEKAEKRHFKLFVTRSSSKEDLKIIQLFDALDKMQDYDEKLILRKLHPVTKSQLANLKTHLYKQLLTSLRVLKTTDNIDLQLSEQLDFARILYNKGLKMQSLKVLEKAKELGAKKLYISATPSENTVNYYSRLGCALATEIDSELFALEPEDIHLEYVIP